MSKSIVYYVENGERVEGEPVDSTPVDNYWKNVKVAFKKFCENFTYQESSEAFFSQYDENARVSSVARGGGAVETTLANGQVIIDGYGDVHGEG